MRSDCHRVLEALVGNERDEAMMLSQLTFREIESVD